MRSITSAMRGEPGMEIIGQASAERARMRTTTSAMQLMSWSLPPVEPTVVRSASLDTNTSGSNTRLVSSAAPYAAPTNSNVAHGMLCSSLVDAYATPVKLQCRATRGCSVVVEVVVVSLRA